MGETLSRKDTKHYKFNKSFILGQGSSPIHLCPVFSQLTVTVLYTEYPIRENIVNLAQNNVVAVDYNSSEMSLLNEGFQVRKYFKLSSALQVRNCLST